jgi:hypothetical protein
VATALARQKATHSSSFKRLRRVPALFFSPQPRTRACITSPPQSPHPFSTSFTLQLFSQLPYKKLFSLPQSFKFTADNQQQGRKETEKETKKIKEERKERTDLSSLS